MRETVGFVGLGHMGEPMCRHLLGSGYDLCVYDADPDAVARLDDTPARQVPSPRHMAAEADVVVLSLPSSEVVEQVVFGESGLAGGFSAGKILIDTSSSKPTSTRSIAAELAAGQVEMLDAPVSGGVLRAEEGKLAIMVGGERKTLKRCLGVLRCFGERIFHVGDHGAGHLVKALNNLLSATTLASAAEAVLLANRAGVDPDVFLEVINASNGRSYSTEVKFPRYILDRSFDDGFAVGLMSKDLRIAIETAAESGFPMLMGSNVAQVWQAAVARGYASESHTAIYAFLEELVGERDLETKTP